jgi:hypothetical protein
MHGSFDITKLRQRPESTDEAKSHSRKPILKAPQAPPQF